MNREEFKRLALREIGHKSGILEDGEPFWSGEIHAGWQASYFVETWLTTDCHSGFWCWCDEFLTKSPLCYYSDQTNKREWWGFNTEKDMLLFLLAWA